MFSWLFLIFWPSGEGNANVHELVGVVCVDVNQQDCNVAGGDSVRVSVSVAGETT